MHYITFYIKNGIKIRFFDPSASMAELNAYREGIKGIFQETGLPWKYGFSGTEQEFLEKSSLAVQALEANGLEPDVKIEANKGALSGATIAIIVASGIALTYLFKR